MQFFEERGRGLATERGIVADRVEGFRVPRFGRLSQQPILGFDLLQPLKILTLDSF